MIGRPGLQRDPSGPSGSPQGIRRLSTLPRRTFMVRGKRLVNLYGALDVKWKIVPQRYGVRSEQSASERAEIQSGHT
jgi:hypothetical protein